MASTSAAASCLPDSGGRSDASGGTNADPGQARLLMEAFETFTKASVSLESAYRQLQEKARRLSEELQARNRELRKSLREKAETQNYLRKILARLPCGVLALDAAGNVTLCNPAASEFLGESEVDFVKCRGRGRPLGSRKLGETLQAAISAPPDGKELETAYERQGRARVLALSGAPLTSACGDRIGTLHIIRDVTEIKALEEQNKRSERLSAMGEMAVELAHEIRNPLGGIELFASLLESELPAGSDAARWAANIRVGSRSLNNIVSNMLHFANPLAPVFRETDLHEIVREVLAFMKPIAAQREVRLLERLRAGRPVMQGDRELLKQMLLNLVHNSMQAMPSRGSLTVATRDAGRQAGADGDGCLELSVRDTGVGIAPEHLDRIFDPFFTTNRNGTGLGLSVVHQIVARHAGRIRVSSRVNRGTCFTITFSRSNAA